MTVVSDTSPINYLALISLQQLLPALFERIIIPAAVEHELRSPAAPPAIKELLSRSPDWLVIRKASSEPGAQLSGLDDGERETITLALELHADLILLDEARGRKTAKGLGLAVTGTLGVLDRASQQGLINLHDSINRLRQTSFRASPKLLDMLVADADLSSKSE